MFQICKNIRPKCNLGVRLCIQYMGVWPKIDVFANFQIFKLLVEYDDRRTTERYFVKFILVVKYTFCKRMVMWHECLRC